MQNKDKLTGLASIDTSVLGSVTGGYGLDLWDSWAFNYLASNYCTDAVNNASANAGNGVAQGGAWGEDAWSAANDAANFEWNYGSACSWW